MIRQVMRSPIARTRRFDGLDLTRGRYALWTPWEDNHLEMMTPKASNLQRKPSTFLLPKTTGGLSVVTLSNGEPSPTNGRPQLADPDKAEAIAVANLVILAVVVICTLYGFTPIHGAHPRDAQSLTTPPGLFLTVETILIVIALTLARVGGTALDALSSSRSTLRLRGSVFVSQTTLWAITLLNYFALATLVQDTGGARSSPFSSLLIGLIALGPYIMTGIATPWLNLIGGLALFTYLLANVLKATQLASTPRSWVYLLTTGLIAFVSVYFVVRARQLTLRDAIRSLWMRSSSAIRGLREWVGQAARALWRRVRRLGR
jgi:hypothetical protein